MSGGNQYYNLQTCLIILSADFVTKDLHCFIPSNGGSKDSVLCNYSPLLVKETHCPLVLFFIRRLLLFGSC